MITIVVGRQRWRRRRAVARLSSEPVDAFGRPNFLFITDTHRKRLQVARDFAERDVFEPAGHVLNALFADLWNRWGDGRAIATRRQLQLLGTRVALDLGLGNGRPERFGKQLADLLSRFDHAGLPPSGEASSALQELASRVDSERFIRESEALAELVARFAAPEPGLRRWLASQPPVIIDDILQPSPMRTRALLALVEALDGAGTDVVIAFECPSIEVPDDVVRFVSGEEEGARHKRFAATHRLRRALFDAFIADGRAQVLFAGADGPVPIEMAPPDPIVPVDERLSVWRCESETAEAEAIAAEVRQHIEAGVPISECHVALASGASPTPLVRALERQGIAVELAEGHRLSESPIGQQAILAIRATFERLSPVEWLALGDGSGLDTRGLHEALQSAGIRSRGPRHWAGPIRAWAVRAGVDPTALVTACEALAALESARSDMEPWRPRLWEWLEHVGILRLAQRSDANTRALAALREELDGGVQEPDFPTDVSGRIAIDAIRARRLRSVPGGVVLTGLLELRGLTPAAVWVAGLTRSRWPASEAPSPLLDTPTRRRLTVLDPLAEARYLLGSLIRNGEHASARRLVLSWPETVGGRATTRSRVLTEWLTRAAQEGRPISEVSVAAALPERAAAPPQGLSGEVHPVPRPSRLSVTAAELAMKCPARFWYRHVLALKPVDPWDPELEPRRRGTAIHRILQEFYEGRDMRPLHPQDFGAAAQRLHAVAERVLAEVEAEGGFDPVLQAWSKGRWLAGLIDDRPLGLLGAWLRGECDGLAPKAVETPVSLGLESVTLRGTVDRLDERPDGSLQIVDYKTGRPPTARQIESGLSLQPLVYVEAMSRTHKRPIASAFQTLARPDTIRKTGWFGDPGTVPPRGLTMDKEARAEALQVVDDTLREVFFGLTRTTQWGPELAGCETCPYRTICRVRHADR